MIFLSSHNSLVRATTVAVTVAAAVAVLLAAPGAGPVLAQDGQTATVSGQVVNGTPGSALPQGLQVVLLSIYSSTEQVVPFDTTAVDAQGRFTFTGVPRTPDVTYQVVANDGAYAPAVDLPPDGDWSNLTLTVYDKTPSLEDLRISSYLMFVAAIDAPTRTMGVLTIAEVTNGGSLVWTPDTQNPGLTGLDLLRFNLPEGYQELSVRTDLPQGNIMEIGTGFALTNPVPPGVHTVEISYLLPYEGDSLTFPLRLPYGSDDVRIVLPEGQGTVSGMGLGETQSVVYGENVFAMNQGQDYERDSQLDVQFSRLPGPTRLQSAAGFFDDRSYMMVIVWVVGAAMVVLLGYALFASRSSRAAATERAKVVQAIADLDAEHDAGGISYLEYTERRHELTEKASRLRVSRGQATAPPG